MLVWIDLETTGLEPKQHQILEAAIIVTHDNFEEVARTSFVAQHPYGKYIFSQLATAHAYDEGPTRERLLGELENEVGISQYVLDMHWKNGLWKDVATTPFALGEVDEMLTSFLLAHSQTEDAEGKVVKAQLAGSTISFDREHMRCGLPTALAELHYRNIDVSTLNELARRHWQTLYATRPNNESKAHRGMADIEESIRVLKHYMKYLVPAVLP